MRKLSGLVELRQFPKLTLCKIGGCGIWTQANICTSSAQDTLFYKRTGSSEQILNNLMGMESGCLNMLKCLSIYHCQNAFQENML